MRTQETVVIPHAMQEYVTEDFLEIVDRFAHTSLEDLVRLQPSEELWNRYRNDTSVMRIENYAPSEYDSTHAVVVPYPYANHHKPSMHLRNLLTQRVLGGNVRLLAFPNNTKNEQYYQLNKKQLDVVAGGDARPVAVGILNTVEAMRIETIDILGYSQGSFVAGGIIQLAQERGVTAVKHALIAEPTTIAKRTEKQLRRDFTGGGLRPFMGAVADSGVPALTEAHSMHQSRAMLGMIAGLLMVQKASKLPENQALHRGMTHDNLATILEDCARYATSESEYPVITLARAERSKVTPLTESYRAIADYLCQKEIALDGYGHEAGDNISGVYALLAKAALTSARN